MNCKRIIEKYLKDNGYGGLVGEEGCSCILGDLMPCGSEYIMECEVAYKIPCLHEKCENKEHCEDWENSPYCMTINKPQGKG